MSDQRLSGKTAVVTGAARGIGEAIARRLAQEGAAVVIADIDLAEAQAVAATLPGAVAAHVDIANDASVAALADFVGGRFGHCEILINNAAILDMTGIETMTMAHYRKVLDINQDGAVRATLAFLPLIKAAGEGRRIVNIASIMGVRGQPDAVPYSTAKGAIVNFTRAIAADLGRYGITVNAVAPGFIDTRMAHLPDGSGHEHDTDWFKDIYLKYGRILLGRAGTPGDIAGPVYFLCSTDAAYVTGQILLVDGGVSATF
ncbi:SDR family oxidoreductase [Mesorhizobium sp. AR07]|uniref:SDR family NAD(P)-dependent oxidoreductase n=1 Tax=Mesorhizobium sp. AR07 TaxID=2865838 RepID=UPI00215FA518|nr:SDR family oxidoreductase [Mesorhizobium sp. AR07]UVK43857.1 SDR family oxidoreductase [Mesorhizobium sp. AR07]